MDQVTLRAEAGRAIGSRPARRLRREGKVPAVVYGRDLDTTSVAVDARELRLALSTEAGYNALINLQVDGSEVLTVAREVQRHPVRGDISHLDFLRISLTETIEADVTLEFIGTPVGVTRDQGILEQVRTSVLIRALPTDIPGHVELDVSELEVGDSLHVSELDAIEGVEFLDEWNTTLVTVIASRVVEEEEPEIEYDEEGEPITVVVEGEEEAAEEASADDEG